MNTILIIMVLSQYAGHRPIAAIEFKTERECYAARDSRPTTARAYCVPLAKGGAK